MSPALAARLLLAAVLAAAAIAKLAVPRASERALESYGFAPGGLRRAAWAGLVAAELALAAGVAVGSDGAAHAAAALMAMFAALMVSAMLRGRAGAPCACFGPHSRIGAFAVGRNLALAAGYAALPSLPD